MIERESRAESGADRVGLLAERDSAAALVGDREASRNTEHETLSDYDGGGEAASCEDVSRRTPVSELAGVYASRARRWVTENPDQRLALFWWLASKVITLVLGWAASAILPANHIVNKSFAGIWRHWDTLLFIDLARHGYGGHKPYLAAFFPLYPMLASVVHTLTLGALSTYWSALVVSWVFQLGCYYLLLRLCRRERSEHVARMSLQNLVIWPTGFFLGVAYSEPVFIFFILLAFWAAREKRWLCVAGAYALASASGVEGVLLGLPILIEMLRSRVGMKTVLAALSSGPAALVAFMIYTFSQGLGFFAFLDAQQHWSRHTVGPWNGLAVGFGDLVHYARWGSNIFVYTAIDLGSALAVLGLVWVMLRGRYRASWIVWTLIVVLVPLSSTTRLSFAPTQLMSMSRLVLPAFPIFVAVADLRRRHPLVDNAVLWAAPALQAFFFVLWTLNYWIA